MAALARRTPRAASYYLLNPSSATSGPLLHPQTSLFVYRSDEPSSYNVSFNGASSSPSSSSVQKSDRLECFRSRSGPCRVFGDPVDPQRGDGLRVISGSDKCFERSTMGSLSVWKSAQLSTFGAKNFAAMASVEERVLRVGEDEDFPLVAEADEGNGGEKSGDLVEIGSEGDVNSLFTPASSLVNVTGEDVLKYITFSDEDLLKYFGEGLPKGLVKEFEATKSETAKSTKSIMIRPQILHLCNLLEKNVTGNEAFKLRAEDAIATRPRRQFLLDGPVGCGKSVAMAMLVQWARAKGWLVFYIPSGKDWTHGSLYYRNEDTGLVDTPITAQIALEGFLKSHSELLDTLSCRVSDPVPLGEGAGVPRVRGPQEFTLPEGATLKQLIEKGLSMSHAGVGTVVRLRKELSLIKDKPVLIAIDDYNSWFVFSEYGVRAKKPIHAQKLAMVHAFRPMEGSSELMVTAFGHSNAVGKLPIHLPDVPKRVRYDLPRYSPVEANTALQYYHRRAVTANDPSEADVVRLYYLTNGNGSEIRTLARLM